MAGRSTLHPSAVLHEEHHALRRLLHVLEGMAGALHEGRRVEEADVRRALDVATGFGDRCHHAKEEQALFPALLDERPGQAMALLADLEADHERGRALVLAMDAAGPAACAGDARAAGSFGRAADEYASLLEAHIRREDRDLLPLADTLRPESRRRLGQQFAQVERDGAGDGAHERHGRAIEELARRYARYARRPFAAA